MDAVDDKEGTLDIEAEHAFDIGGCAEYLDSHRVDGMIRLGGASVTGDAVCPGRDGADAHVVQLLVYGEV